MVKQSHTTLDNENEENTCLNFVQQRRLAILPIVGLVHFVPVAIFHQEKEEEEKTEKGRGKESDKGREIKIQYSNERTSLLSEEP